METIEKKKIVLVGTSYPFRGGLASYNERLIKEFNTCGYDTSISTFTLQYPNFLFPGKTQYSSSPKPTDLTIIEEVNSVNPANWIKVGKRLAKEAPDFIIVKFWLPFMGPCFGTICRLAKRNKKTKIIAIVDNIIPHEKRIGDNMLSNYFVKCVDGFIAMSEDVMNDLNTFDKDKPKILSPHPIFDNFGALISREEAIKNLNLDENSATRYILFFGFIRDYKGLDLLIKAFADSRFRTLDVKLIIAGEFYSNGTKYLDLIKELKLEEYIISKNDFIPDEEVKNYFRAADIIAQPYKTATQSGVTQIGYHFEKPMLVTNVGGLAEIIPHNKVGYVVEPNESAIADALFDFFTSDKKEEFEANVKSEKQKYSWEIMVKSIEKLYHEIQK